MYIFAQAHRIKASDYSPELTRVFCDIIREAND
jgi:hypothetical protein